jgi:hypothetical protein
VTRSSDGRDQDLVLEILKREGKRKKTEEENFKNSNGGEIIGERGNRGKETVTSGTDSGVAMSDR